jgi:hypothetical protein
MMEAGCLAPRSLEVEVHASPVLIETICASLVSDEPERSEFGNFVMLESRVRALLCWHASEGPSPVYRLGSRIEGLITGEWPLLPWVSKHSYTCCSNDCVSTTTLVLTPQNKRVTKRNLIEADKVSQD